MLAFIRHGQTDWNLANRLQGVTDIPLNATGRQQAVEAGRRLRQEGTRFDLVITSPLDRAQETGRLVARELGIEVLGTDEDLLERSFGTQEGTVVKGISTEDYDRLMAAAEPAEQVAERGARVLRRVRAEHPGRSVLLVAHGTLIRLTMDALTGRVTPRIPNTGVVPVDEALLDQDPLPGLEPGRMG